jgi:hypothetical protein
MKLFEWLYLTERWGLNILAHRVYQAVIPELKNQLMYTYTHYLTNPFASVWMHSTTPHPIFPYIKDLGTYCTNLWTSSGPEKACDSIGITCLTRIKS